MAVTRTFATLAATGGLLAILILGTLPPRPLALSDAWKPALPGAVVRGVFHVHTRRSDGTGTVEEVARAAAAAGLDFLILADHGDGLRTPDPPRYLSGVLVIDGVEVSTRQGHYAVVGLTRPTPTRLAGWADEVVEDARRYGGRGIVTHPDSPRASLAWADWEAPVDAFEWFNADTQWRDERPWRLVTSLAHYPFRPIGAVVAVFDRPAVTLRRWDRLAAQGRFLPAIAGADAHARLGLRSDNGEDAQEGPGMWTLRVPSYEALFRAVSTSVELERPWRDDGQADAAALLDALFAGRSYTVVDGLASPGRLEFHASSGAGLVRMGTIVRAGTALTFIVRTNAPPGSIVRLVRNGVVVAESTGVELAVPVVAAPTGDERGVSYRVEVELPGAPGQPPIPWIVSNPIFIGSEGGGTGPGVGERPTRDAQAIRGIDLRACVVERDDRSMGGVEASEDGDRLELSYTLGEDRQSWVAVACPLGSRPSGRAVIVFGVEGEPVQRLAVQVRSRATGHRWGRSTFVEPAPSRIELAIRGMRPVGDAQPNRPSGDLADLLFVLDRTHGRAGTRGRLVIRELRIHDAPAPQVGTVSSR